MMIALEQTSRLLSVALAACLLASAPGARFATAAGAAAPADAAPDSNHTINELLDAGQYAEAETAARARLAEVEARDGPEAASVADVLDILVSALRLGGKPGATETRALAGRAVAIREREAGKRPLALAGSLRELGFVLQQTGDLTAARPVLDRALALRTAALGEQAPEVGESLRDLSSLLLDIRDLDTARPLAEQALAIAERAASPDARGLASALGLLANIDFIASRYAEARPLYEREAAIWEAAYGAEHPRVGRALFNLASLDLVAGDYAAALPRLERVIELTTRRLGPEHPDLAPMLTNYGAALLQVGDTARSREMLERALAIQEKAYGVDHPGLANVLVNLGVTLDAMGEFEAEKTAYLRAIAIVDKAAGPGHPDTALWLLNLGNTLRLLGDLPEAAEKIETGLKIAEASLGPDHQVTGRAHFMLALVSMDQTRYDEAQAQLDRARAILTARMGPSHYDVADAWLAQAELAWRRGTPAAALAPAEAAAQIIDAGLRLTLTVLPEKQALQAYANRKHPEEFLFSGLLHDPDERAGWLAACWHWSRGDRGLVLEELAARGLTAAGGDDPGIVAARERLGLARDHLASLWVQGAEPGSEAEAAIAAARRDRDQAESALAEKLSAMRRYLTFRAAAESEAEPSLPTGSALAEIARVSIRSLRGTKGIEHYIALIRLASGRSDFADLGAADQVDALVGAWRRALDDDARDTTAGESTTARDSALADTGRQLRRQVWDPLADRLGATRRLFLVPDGALNEVYLPGLPTDDGRFVIEAGPVIHLLGTGRDLIRLGSPAGTRSGARGDSSGLLAMGAPEFGHPPAASAAAAPPAPPATTAPAAGAWTSLAARGSACMPPSRVTWTPLPESKREVDTVAALFRKHAGATILTGAAASETRFRHDAAGHRVLHLATHGYFLGEECATGDVSPLLLSGLVLAGAGTNAGGSPDVDDGILTAEEVVGLDLGGLDLAVLSACDTGLGRIGIGDGVVGLRRAFEIAGARSLVMSLWSVPDRQARRWMASFYGAWLAGTPIPEAARAASLDLLTDLRSRGRLLHPYFWGGFVTAGDWRPTLVTKQ